MSLLQCGQCTKSKISDSLVSGNRPASVDTSYDILEDRIAVRGVTMASDSNARSVYNVTEMEPNPSHYNLLIVIGKGCYDKATVSLAKHVPSDTLVAVKRLQLEDTDVDFSMLQHEQLMHRKLRHSNLLPSLCSFVHENELWTVMPLMAFGSCRDLLHAHFAEGLPELALAYILHDLLQGLEYMHQRGIIHCAVRASHVLVSATGQVALTGFRHVLPMMSFGKRHRMVHAFPNFYHSSLLWASPELLEQNLGGYDTKSDIYSFGILICELANGVVPFADMPMTQMLLEKMEGTTPRLLDSRTIPEIQLDNGEAEAPTDGEMPYQRTFSMHLHNLVELCLQTDPALRPTAAALLQHSFFRQLKRKSGMEALPELLKPVSPLTSLDLEALSKETNGAVDGVAEQLEDMGVDDWIFEGIDE